MLASRSRQAPVRRERRGKGWPLSTCFRACMPSPQFHWNERLNAQRRLVAKARGLSFLARCPRIATQNLHIVPIGDPHSRTVPLEFAALHSLSSTEEGRILRRWQPGDYLLSQIVPPWWVSLPASSRKRLGSGMSCDMIVERVWGSIQRAISVLSYRPVHFYTICAQSLKRARSR